MREIVSPLDGFESPLGRQRGGASLPLDLPLDNISAVLAFSTARKLRTAYTGDAIRVRESSGDTETDIGFDANGDLDEAALLSHCGSNDGFIVTMYDQSGDVNAVNFTQATASLQPQIVSAGTVIKKDGHVAFERPTDGAGAEYVSFSSWNTRPSNADLFYVASFGPIEAVFLSSTISGDVIFGVMDDGSSAASESKSGSLSYAKNNAAVSSPDRNVLYDTFATSSLLIAETIGLDLTASSGWASAGTLYTSSPTFNGAEYVSELILLSDPSAADADAIRSNQGTYYGITLS